MVTTIEKSVERKVRTSAEMLTQVSGSVPTTGRVFDIAMHSPVYTLRPVLFTGAAGCSVASTQLPLRQQLPARPKRGVVPTASRSLNGGHTP